MNETIIMALMAMLWLFPFIVSRPNGYESMVLLIIHNMWVIGAFLV